MGATDRIEDLWPIFGLRVRTPRLELRPPDEDLMVAIAALAAQGIHDPATMPFEVPWTDAPSAELPRDSLRFLWRCWGTLEPTSWRLPLAVLVDGRVVGVQDVAAEDFARRRTVSTGSWLGRAHQGQGVGKEMRAAVLHLAFAGLGARRAETGAWHDNAASLRVTEALGYRPNGDRLALRRDVVDRQLLFALDRATWEQRQRHEVELVGVDAAAPLLGAHDATIHPPDLT